MVETILRMKVLPGVTGMCPASIYNMIEEGKFPRPIPLSRQSVGWLASEVAAWQQARIAERDGTSEKEAA